MVPALPALRRFALELTREPADADDLVQETLLKAYRHRDHYTPGTNIRAWLFTILRNTFVNELRRRHAQQGGGLAQAGASWHDEPSHRAGPEETWLSRMIAMELLQAVDTLPPPYREVLQLRAIRDLSYRQIAEHLGIPEGTVKSRIHRGRRMLRRKLRTKRHRVRSAVDGEAGTRGLLRGCTCRPR